MILKIRLYQQRCPVFCHCPSLWLIYEPFGKSLSFNLFDFERCVWRQSLCFFPLRCRRSFEKVQCALTQLRIRTSLAFVYYDWWLIPEHLLNFFGNPPILNPFSFLFSQWRRIKNTFTGLSSFTIGNREISPRSSGSNAAEMRYSSVQGTQGSSRETMNKRASSLLHLHLIE